jgi:hypothetical protein
MIRRQTDRQAKIEAPLDLADNLKWREYVFRRGARDASFRKLVLEYSARDPLFFINTFTFSHDPRIVEEGVSNTTPFVTYPFQVAAVKTMAAAVGKHDVLCEKSRDQGATWMFLLVMLWYWRFRGGLIFNLMSRTAELVDTSEDLNALMPKLDFAVRHWPKWVQPKYSYYNMRLTNLDNKSIFRGFSTTRDAARAGRCTAALMDELAFFEAPDGYGAVSAMSRCTNTRFLVSTPNGTGNAFYDQREKGAETGNPRMIRLHWSDHPVHSKGLYEVVNGEIKVLDEGYSFPADYPFNERFRDRFSLRSVWFDEECNRAGRESEVRQELEIDYLSSGAPFFSQSEIRAAIDRFARPPERIIDIMRVFDPEHPVISDWLPAKDEFGNLALWVPLVGRDKAPPRERHYAFGIDVSAGTEASNSVISIGDLATRQKVGQFVSNKISPHNLGCLVHALGKWFGCGEGDTEAYVIWEALGPGQSFQRSLFDCGYSNFYYREIETKRYAKSSQVPGWHPGGEARRVLLQEYAASLNRGEFDNPSREAISEMSQFRYFPGGKIYHTKAVSEIDPSGNKMNHGDMVIADALLNRAFNRCPVRQELEAVVPENCLQARLDSYNNMQKGAEAGNWFDQAEYERQRAWRRKTRKWAV